MTRNHTKSKQMTQSHTKLYVRNPYKNKTKLHEIQAYHTKAQQNAIDITLLHTDQLNCTKACQR